MPKLNVLSPVMVVPIGVAVAIMLVSGYVQGKWSERWGTFPELEIYAKQLEEIPKDVGEWEGQDAAKSDEKILKIAGAEGEMTRVYRNAAGQEVRVSIICGRLQDVFYHTPDRCYPAAGFEMQGDPQPEVFEIDNTTAEFLTTTFLKSEPTGTHAERGYWSWSADGKWIAPKSPKLEFAGQKALYKLYVFATIAPGSKIRASDEPSANFIRAFMPALERALRPAIEKARIGKQEVSATPSGA
jgi:hypothetical protein